MALAHLLATATAAALACSAGAAWAQYKVIGPDGRVTYTDRPAPEQGHRVVPMSRSGVAAAEAAERPAASVAVSPNPALPLELRNVAARFPVTLYTTADCSACDSGRALLTQRGIPYSERRIGTEDDVNTLQRQFGWRVVPSITIGGQALRGFNAAEWTGFLDAAGYPAESRLPRSWPAPTPTPMSVAPAPARAAVAEPPPAEPPPLPAAPPPPAGGIRF